MNDQDRPSETRAGEKPGEQAIQKKHRLHKRPLIPSELDRDDPDYAKHQIALEMFRSISVGKIIAVIGSGVTVPYGYDSWERFTDNLLAFITDAWKTQTSAASQATKKSSDSTAPLLTDAGLRLYAQYNDLMSLTSLSYIDKRAICDALFTHLTEKGKKSLHQKYKEWFSLRQRIEKNDAKIEALLESGDSVETQTPLQLCDENFLPTDLGRILELFRDALESHKSKKKKKRNPEFEFKKKKLDSPLERISSSRNIVDPLKTLRASLRINRFATFNYDLEIEAMLEDLDYPYNELTRADKEAIHDTQSRLGSNARSISLSPQNTSELIALAAMPSSDDAMIVHMHGSVAKPEDMVVTQREYNALYIDDYPGHSSFDDARRLMFGGNAILYLGVGLSEEDLMRPLRYLASSMPDRPIYALVPSLHSVGQDMAMIQRMKMSYGVNVIPYGWSYDMISRAWPIDPPRHELGSDFNALHDELDNVRTGLKRMLRGELTRFEDAFSKASTPRLESHERLFAILRRMNEILRRKRAPEPGATPAHLENSLHQCFMATVKGIAMSMTKKTSSLPGDPPLEVERKSIARALSRKGASLISLRRDFNQKNTPRLHRDRHYVEICGVIDRLTGSAPANEREFISFFENLIIGTALDHVLKYLAGATAIWRKRWQILPAPYFFSNWNPTVLHYTGADASMLSENERHAAADIYAGIIVPPGEHFFVLNFDSKSRKSAFLSYVESARKSDPSIGDLPDSHDAESICIYCLDHLIAPNSLLPGIFQSWAPEGAGIPPQKRVVFIRGAERLLDSRRTHTQNLLVEKMLRYARDSAYDTGDRYVFITGDPKAALYFEKFFNAAQEWRAIPWEHDTSQQAHSDTPIARIRGRYHWARRVYDAIEAEILAKHSGRKAKPTVGNDPVVESNEDSGIGREQSPARFLDLCNDMLEARLANSDEKHHRSIFCGVMLDARHLWVRENGSWDDKIKVVVEHTILKWMFTIHIPMNASTISSLIEIGEIEKAYSLGPRLGAVIQDALHNLEKCALIYRISNVYSKSDPGQDKPVRRPLGGPRYVLHKQVRMFLAHKRGLSFGWMDHREWNTATVCNAIAEGGPLFSRKDYIDACAQFDAFIDAFHGAGFADDNSGFPARSALNCAHSMIRGHLYAHNAIRAGMNFLPDSHRRSVLDEHISRLCRLRSSSLLLSRNGDTSWLPPFYESFDVWVVNEIAVMRYMQGDFHDCVMLFREALDFCERKSSGYALDDDPTLVPRLRINLALSLVERARFDEALRQIEAATAELECTRVDTARGSSAPSAPSRRPQPWHAHPIACAQGRDTQRASAGDPHPEYLLLRAMAYGCRAQIELLMAKLDRARKSIKESLENIDGVDVLGVRGWLHSTEVLLFSATGDLDCARSSLGKALAAAHGSLRPDLIMSLEIARAEFQMRDSAGDRQVAISTLSSLSALDKTARKIGSRKGQVSVLLIRARILLYLEQVDSARDAALEAICQALQNGMRLKRITGLVLISAIMAMRGETAAARKLLHAVRLSAVKMRYIRAVVDIDRLDRAINIDGGVAQWAGYLSEYDASDARRHHH